VASALGFQGPPCERVINFIGHWISSHDGQLISVPDEPNEVTWRPHLNASRTFVFLLGDTTRLYTQRLEKRSGVLGLTLAQCRVLVHLVDHEGISQVHLAELTELFGFDGQGSVCGRSHEARRSHD
jgi:hypothetical protein